MSRDEFAFIREADIEAIGRWMYHRIDQRECAGCNLGKNYMGPTILREECWSCFDQHKEKA